MTLEPRARLDPRFSGPDATPTPWPQVRDLLEHAELFWIATVGKDARPHVTPLPAVWFDDALHFCTGAQEQKHRNLEGDPRVAVTTGSTGARRWDSGSEVVVEGTAVRVRDHDALQELADAWSAKYGDDWRFAVRGEEFVELSGSGGGSGGAEVYRVAPGKVLAFGGGHGQTRYRF
jgi:nitroimidazol reductase NimA-like FMN-containing flavoprotein (pyridoxamine 5'-phosphate oxidase superfamily)